MSNLGDFEKLKVPDLKAALKARGLNTGGNKKQLIERLIEASSLKSDVAADDDDEEVNEDYVLGDGDETIEDDQKSGDLFINEEAMLSPVIKSKPLILKPTTPEKENHTTTIPKSDSSTTLEVKSGNQNKLSPTNVTSLSEQERRELRFKRFNAAGDDKVKIARAERFGLLEKGNSEFSNSDSGVVVDGTRSLDKLKMRASRFGVVSSASLMKTEDKERILKRKARFGIGTTIGQLADEEERKKKRAERFGIK